MTEENDPAEQPSRPIDSVAEQPTNDLDPALSDSRTIRFGRPFTLEGLTVDHRYYIEKELGRGGMGIVYLGRDRRLHEKPVVVKVLLEKSLKNPWVMQKFEQEREALARVDHPGVVGILDTGKLADGKPYIVMQYIDGRSLRETIAASSKGLDLRQAAILIKQIGAALHAVHEKNIYHRDLKPENILLQRLSRIDEQVKIVDFGIAKVKDSIVAPSTITGGPGAGTVLYMSPEQLHGEKITAASDIYSFGVIAYELVTRQRPFKPATIAQLADMQREGVRVKPRDLRPQLTAEADAAILKALAFDHTQRYQSAHEFGSVLAAALVNEAERDKPEPSFTSETLPGRRIVFPKPRGLVSTVESTITTETRHPTSEVQIQRTSPSRARAKLTGIKLLLGLAAVVLLSVGYLFVANWKSFLRTAKPPELYVQTGHWREVQSVAFSFDGKMLATGGGDFQIKLWDIASGQEVRTLIGQLKEVAAIAFSPDGKLLASVGEKEERIRVWNLATGVELKSFSGPTEARILFSPDNQFLAVASSDGSIRLWNATDGVEVKTLQTDDEGEDVTCIAFSPDGKMLASIEPGVALKLWELPTGKNLRTMPLDQGSDGLVVFSSDGGRLWSYASGVIKQLDVKSGTEISSVTVVADKSHSYEKIALSSEAKFFATVVASGADFTLLNVATGRESEISAVSQTDSSIKSISFSPDGAMLAIGDDVGGVTLWDVANNKKLNIFESHSAISLGVAFGPDGKTIASASGDKTIKVWNLPDGNLKLLQGHTDPLSMVAFSPDGRTLASGSEDDTMKLWDLSTNTELKSFNVGRDVQGVAFSPNGATLASVSLDVQLWDIATGVELRTFKLSGEAGFMASFSPDGQLLACGDGHTVKIWNVSTGYELHSLTSHSGNISSVLFSPDNKMLASGSEDMTVKIWDVTSGAELKSLSGHTGWVLGVTFSPDGKTLATSSIDKTIRLWDVATGNELKKILLDSDVPGLVAFSPDGHTLVSGSLTGRTYLWAVSSGAGLASFIALDKNEWAVTTSDGRFDGSVNGLKLLHYVQDNKPISLERFSAEFRTPRLLQQLAATN